MNFVTTHIEGNAHDVLGVLGTLKRRTRRGALLRGGEEEGDNIEKQEGSQEAEQDGKQGKCADKLCLGDKLDHALFSTPGSQTGRKL